LRRWGWLLAAWLALLFPHGGRAETIELTTFEVVRNEEGVLLSYAVNFELPRSVEEALVKGVSLYFYAEAEIFQERWYWRDKRLAKATRGWRVTYQPLTRKYRVSAGGLNQNYETLNEALDTLRKASRWKIAEPGQVDDDGKHYVEFSFRLDTTQLPRPMQIGIGGQAEWTLGVERVQRFN